MDIWRKKGLFLPNRFFQLLTVEEQSNRRVLCEDCQYNIQYVGYQYFMGDVFDPHHPEFQTHHTKPEDLQKAALQGCAICGALWRKLSVSQQRRVLSLDCSGDYAMLTSITITALPVSKTNGDVLVNGGPETALIDVNFPSGSGLSTSDLLDQTILFTQARFILYPTAGLSPVLIKFTILY